MTGSLSRVRRFTIAKVFIDTNVLIYAEDQASSKRDVARGLLREVSRKGSGVISTQVLQEFYNNVTRKLGATPAQAVDLMKDLRRFEVVVLTPDLIEEAAKIHAMRQTPFWDSLIVSAAAFAKCKTLYSEDFNPGQNLSGVKVVNPFAAKVDV